MQKRRPTRWAIHILVMALLAIAGGSAGAEGQDPPAQAVVAGYQETTGISPVPRPIYLYAGTCDALGAIQWPLNSLASPDGEPGGAEDRDRTEYSFTANVPLGIDLMLAGEYAIAVHESGDNLEQVLVCANIGGVTDGAGTLVVGLRQAGELPVSGIAVLSPSPANPTMTLISIFISGSGLGDEVGTIGNPPAMSSDPAVAGDNSPPVTDAPPPVNPDPGDDDDDDDDDD